MSNTVISIFLATQNDQAYKLGYFIGDNFYIIVIVFVALLAILSFFIFRNRRK